MILKSVNIMFSEYVQYKGNDVEIEERDIVNGNIKIKIKKDDFSGCLSMWVRESELNFGHNTFH